MVDWDGIIDREGPVVWRTVRRLLTSRADAEECFQETFVAALELWRREPVRSPRAALQRLATARAIDRLRKRYRLSGRESTEPPTGVADPAPSPPDRAVAAELAEALRAAVANLPEKQADVFCLHCIDGNSYSEIAEALGLSVDAVGVLLHRARARLRAALPADARGPRRHAVEKAIMNQDPEPNSRDERYLDEMTAALRDAGASEKMPPELKRSTLQALWVADAARHEKSSARRAGVARRAVQVAAVVAIVCCGVAVASLVSRAWKKSETRNVWNAGRATTAPYAVPTVTQPVEAYGPQRPAVVLGKITLVGQPPYPTLVDVSATPECRLMHPNGLFDDSLVVGDQRGIANVVVSVESADGSIPFGAMPSSPAVLDQRGCQYVPHVLAVTVGQPIIVRNSDPFLHNVHSLALDNPAFNFGQPNIDPGRAVGAMRVAETFVIKCDIHPWMRAYVNVFNHPYHCVTGPDGAFAIPGSLPDGRYTLVAWHEKLGEKRTPVELKGGRPILMDLEFSTSSLSGE